METLHGIITKRVHKQETSLFVFIKVTLLSNSIYKKKKYLLWIIINITCFLGTRCSHRNPYKATCLELQVLMRCLWVSTALCALLQQEVVTETLRLTAGVQTTGDPSSRVAMWPRRSIGVTTPNTICLWQVQPSAFSGERQYRLKLHRHTR